MNEAVDGTINQISSSTVEWLSSFVFSLLVARFQTLSQKGMNEAVDSTINQISSSSFEWWSSFVCSLFVALFREAF